MSDLHVWSFEGGPWWALVVAPTEGAAFQTLVRGGLLTEEILDDARDCFLTHRFTQEELEGRALEGPERDARLSDLLDAARQSGAAPFVLATSKGEWEVVPC